MGRPPLPAATESGTDTAVDDVETDVSRATDRSSYSIPEDGSPIVIKKTRTKTSSANPNDSQTSLIIEYFEGGRAKDRSSSTPRVRLQVNPSSAKKPKNKDAVYITEQGKDRKPTSTRRISLSSNKPEQSGSRAVQGTDLSNSSGDDPPIEFALQNRSDVSSYLSNPPAMHPTTSDVSSMPADSILDAPLGFRSPEKNQTSRSLDERPKKRELVTDSLKAPPPRTRSVSRERIARKAAEKLSQESRTDDASAKRRARKSRDSTGSRDIVEDAYDDYKARSRSSKTTSRPGSGDYRSGVESSFLRPPRDVDSNVSAASKVSFANDPRLLQTVEDAIRRMILPKIDELKRRQAGASDDRELNDRTLSKSSSAPQMKAKRSSRRDSDGTTRESTRERRHKTRDSRRSSGTSEGLTAEALRDHNARSRERERRERRKHSKSESRSNSIPNTEESYEERSKIPPMPLTSDVGDSDLTRESILSAETTAVEGERPTTGNSRSAPPVQQVLRGSPTTVPLPESRGSTQTPADSRNITPTQLEQTNSPRTSGSRGDLKAATSDKNISAKARGPALTAVGLGGAAGAMYGIGRYKAERSRSRELAKAAMDKRDTSPAQTVSSYRKSDAYTDDGDRPVSRDWPKETETKEPATRSMESVQSAESAQYLLTQKRHKGVNLEKQDQVLERDLDNDDHSQANQSEDDFFKDQQRLNDEYRSSGDFDAHRDSAALEDQNRGLYQGDTQEGGASKDLSPQQHVRDVGANAQVVGSPVRAESEVASLLDPSQLSSSYSRDVEGEQSPTETNSQTAENEQASPTGPASRGLQTEHPNPSQDRWAQLRENARALSHSKESLDNESPQNNVSRSVKSDEKVQMGASGLPVANDPLPEIGMGLDTASDSLSDPSLKEHPSSVLEGPMGDENENRDHWPYEPTPPVSSKRQAWVEPHDPNERYISAGNAALNGAVAGLGIGAAGAAVGAGAARQMQTDSQDSMRLLSSESSASRENVQNRNIGPSGRNAYPGYSNSGIAAQTPGYPKDEGYISAAPATRSADDITPLSFSKPPPRLFDDRDLGKFQNTASGPDPFVTDKRARYLSGNSHGMSSPHYDASTGKGINGIQSKDVVALMDHLTVRDGQRNARDTEILVTLVRSAAESRDAFEEVKKLIENGQNASMQHTDRGINKVLNAPRPQVLGSPRTPQSTEDLSGKKRNIFKRALKGLSSKSTNDLSRIEDMLNHLLDEVENLKGAQANPDSGPSLAPRGSLDSYEQMRAAPESGYEPEGQAGTGSTPNQSGYFSPQSRQGQPRLHSGYVAAFDTEKRVSTVLERDEELDDYNGEDRLLTPTQEVQQQRSSGFATTPQRLSTEYRDINEVSPPTNEKNRKTKSTNSSLWGVGVPRISRWSKTTASSDNRTSIETTPGRKDLPYSEASRSGSEVNVLPPDGAPWVTSQDDRLRSAGSLGREAERSSSPLIPTPTTYPIPMPVGMEDPKYKANRKSLTLQHPQPRQGPTHRHQSNLEDQAYAYGGSPSDPRSAGDPGMRSPDSDTFGSMPSLARLPGNMGANRYSGPQHYVGGTGLSPISSEGSAPSTRNRGPIVPPQAPLVQQQRVPEQDTYSNASPIQDDDSADDVDDDESHGDMDAWDDDPAVPLPRKRSPYSPGGLLAPIEERYSMEGDRSSIGYSLSQKSRRESVDLKNGGGANSNNNSGGTNSIDMGYQQQQGLADVMEQDEGERTLSPVADARPAVGAAALGAGGAGEVRKLTGPREMPPRKVSSEAGGVLRGTVRRKPVVSGSWDD